jgi:hypothetical protein
MAWGAGLKCDFGMIVINDEEDPMNSKCRIQRAVVSE